MKLKIIVLVIIVIAIVGGGIYWWQNMNLQSGNSAENSAQEKIAGDYQWTDKTLESQYADVLWNKITTGKLTGFSPAIPLTEEKTDYPKICANRDTGNYLRIEGGLCGVGYWLQDSAGNKIDSREKLAGRFVPVESEAEAVSFVVVTEGGLVMNSDGVLVGHTLSVDGQFLVQLAYSNAYGCGNHEPTGVIFKVLKNGTFQQVAAEKQKPLKPEESTLCVD